MVKLFIVCSKKNSANIEKYLGLERNFEFVLPKWYNDSDEVSENFKKDVESLQSCDAVLIVDTDLNLYTYSELYEAYRINKPIYTVKETPFFKTLINVLGIEYELASDLTTLPFSKYVKTDKNVQNLKGTTRELMNHARFLLNDFEKEPTVVYLSRDNDIIFEWLSDPEKVDYCKYFVQLILYLDGTYKLKVMYYNEDVCDKKSTCLTDMIYKVNRYVHDFESLMR